MSRPITLKHPVRYCAVCGEQLKFMRRHEHSRKQYCSRACMGRAWNKRTLSARLERTKLIGDSDSTKVCRACGEVLPKTLEFFPPQRGGLYPYCRLCQAERTKASQVKRYGSVRGHGLYLRYRITESDYNNMLERQGGVCLICERKRVLVVDHDHKSGRVRGLICTPCNLALSTFSEDDKIFERAMKYLKGLPLPLGETCQTA